MIKFYTIIFLILLIRIGHSQCPNSDFTININGCVDQTFEISNVITIGDEFEFDFCAKDLEQNPDVALLFRDLNWDGVSNIKLVNASGLWVGFIASTNNHKIFRLDFGKSIENPDPIITDLGNIDGQFVNPESIDIYEENNLFYGLVVNYKESSLVRLNFGTSLTNIPTSEKITINISHNLSFGSSISVLKENSNVYALLVNRGGNDLIKLSFGNSITNLPLIESLNLTGLSSPRGLTYVHFCENSFYIYSFSTNSNTFHRIEFTSLSLPPTITNLDVTGDIISGGITPILLNDFGKYYLLLSSQSGDLYRINIGDNILNNDVTSQNLTNFGIIPNTTAFDVIPIEGKFFGYSIGANKFLYNYNFEDICPTLVPYIKDSIPNTITYFEDGNFGIELTSKNSSNNTFTKSQSITISPSLAPKHSASLSGNCLSSPINFSGQQISGDIAAWNWSFGDGSGTSNLQNANYTYGAAGEYQVRLNVTDANGCNNLVIDTVQVYEEPIPNFSVPGGDLCMNNELAFYNTSTGETGTPVTWTWDFNGEGSSNEKEPTFTFLNSGSKTITLTSSIPGCANVTQQTITIEEAPTTTFSFNNTCNTQTTTFTDETTGSNLTSWNWDFGDGNNSTDQSPTHTYATAGKYVVTLSVSNDLGCTTTKVDTVYNHSIPVANFSNDLACSTSPIQFADESLVTNANLVAWEWNFGDGNISTDQNPQHLYNQIGDFTVKLKAYSQFGCVDSTQIPIIVAQGPQVDFEWDKACQGEATTFTDLTNSFGVSITNWNWVVDGTLLTSQNPTYTFSNSGTYTVQLSVTVNNLCAQTMTQDIIVEIPPTVQFDYSEGCGGTGTTFYDLTDQTDDPIISREWRVDGSVIPGDSIAPVQLAPGTYAITLSIITSAGCEETTTSNVSLIGSPIADFEVNTVYGAGPLEVNFSNLSSGGSNYLWSFGDPDSTTSDEQNPTFTYDSTGIFTTTLRTSSDPNCYDERSIQIEVVEAESSAEIISLTPITTNNITNFVVTIENSGTNLIDNSFNLIFRADYGTEVIEPINTIIYAEKTINYTSSYAISSSSNPTSVCVELVDSNYSQMDKSCINLNASVNISEPYPNPSQGLITVDVMLENATAIKVRVINRSGQPVLTQAFDGTKGLNKLLLDAQALPQGLYIIEVNSGGKTEQFKTSIIR